tara:strand:+ start:1101 stop:2168 length:1068 start_codon:yes stop_codon:yes gene_type:complete
MLVPIAKDKDFDQSGGQFSFNPETKKYEYKSKTQSAVLSPKEMKDLVKQGKVDAIPDLYSAFDLEMPVSGEMKELMAMQQPRAPRVLSEADKDEIVKAGGGVDASDTAMSQISGKSSEDVYAEQMKKAQTKDLVVKLGLPLAAGAAFDLANLVMPTETEKKLQDTIDSLAKEDPGAEVDKYEREATGQLRAGITEARQREEARSAALGGERVFAARDLDKGREASREAIAKGVADISERGARMEREAEADIERRRLQAELQKAGIADQKRQQFFQGATDMAGVASMALAGTPMAGPATPETLGDFGLDAGQYAEVMGILGQKKFRTRSDAYTALSQSGMEHSDIMKILASGKLVR